MSLNDRRFVTQTEELLGLRGVKANRAVRYRDLAALRLDALPTLAAAIGTSDAVKDIESTLEDVQAAVDAANQAANDAAIEAQNANIAAADAQTYADGLVAQVYTDMGENFETMESSLNLIAQAQGRETSCLSDMFLVSSDWTRLTGQGTLDLLTNQLFPIGRTWQFTVGQFDQDGIWLNDAPATIWPGQTDAAGYVVEINYTLLSGSLAGAGVILTWSNASVGGDYTVAIPLSDMQAGVGVAGRSRLAQAVFLKPTDFTGTFTAHSLQVYVNENEVFAPSAAKTIQIHRINVRPATREEMGQGVVMDSVQAHLSENYLTAAGTEAAIATADLTLNASLEDTFATVQRTDTAIASIDGTVARFRNIATVNGEVRAGIEAVAFDGTGGGTGSVVKLIGDDVIAEGTLSAGRIIVHDGSGNLFPDPAFSLMSLAGWSGDGHAFMYPMAHADIPGTTIKDNAPASTVLYLVAHAGQGNKRLISPKFEALAGTEFDLAFDYAVASSGSHQTILRLNFFNSAGGPAGIQQVSVTTAPASWQRYRATAIAPAGAVRAEIQIISVDTALTHSACATNFSVIRKRSGATLIEPNSLTTALVNTTDFNAAGLAVFGGTLQSDDFNAGTGTGWRITKAGTMNMPNAIITSAKIANAAITSAKIGDAAVNTLKLAGDSVSVIFSNTGSTNTATAGVSVSVTADYAARVLVIGYGNYLSQSSIGQLRLERSGTFLRQSRYGTDSGTVGGLVTGAMVMWSQNISAGSYTFRVEPGAGVVDGVTECTVIVIMTYR